MTRVVQLKIENQDTLLGTDILQPHFSWKLSSEKENLSQSAYQLQVLDTDHLGIQKIIWDSKQVNRAESIGIQYEGPPLQSRSIYSVKVRVWDSTGSVSAWSNETQWEMGLLRKEDWIARWIEPEQQNVTEEPEMTLADMFINKKKQEQLPPEQRLHSPKLVRKAFQVQKKIEKARLYITAHGLYHATINGEKVTDAEFTPDFTSYLHFLQYQTYDVTSYICDGENVLGIILADGWYAGRISVPGGSAQFGNRLGLLVQLEITYTDHSKQIIESNNSFLSTDSQYIYSDIFIGEKLNRNLEKIGWDRPEYHPLSSEWKTVGLATFTLDNLRAQYGEYVKPIETIKPKCIWRDENGSYIIDFGQVIAGRIRLNVKARKGQAIKFEHSEVLDEHGRFFNNIMGRNKDQTDYYIASGEMDEVFEPRFTFHGFRYVRLSGFEEELFPEDISAIVLYSAMKLTGDFSTSNKEINQLWRNIQWSQKGNMISIPTDCPQRERAGWTGDLQVFAPTATFNMDVQSFLIRWLQNLQLEQTEEGEVLNFCPAPKDIWNDLAFTGSVSSAGWGDAIIIVPLVLYQRYGNKQILEQCFPAMEKWLAFVQTSAARGKGHFKKDYSYYLWDTKFHFGDWMIPSLMLGEKAQGPMASSAATKDSIATAFYAYSARLLSEIAEIIGNRKQAQYYKNLSDKVKEAFNIAYVKGSGLLSADYQGVYTIALFFDLLPDDRKIKAVHRLVELIEENQNRLDTGFLSIPYILDVLCDNGYEHLAYKLLFQTECPSWLYAVSNGATTIWESWEAIKPNGTVGSFSFNHYAFGCVGDWIVRHIGGLTSIEPGYRKFKVEPHYCEGITNAETKYESVYGEIKVKWQLEAGKQMNLQVKVPPNSVAIISLINIGKENLAEVEEQVGTHSHFYEDENRFEFTVGSGIIEVKYTISEKIIERKN